MNQGTKIFIACTLGSLIGTLTAINIAPYIWWLGLIIGLVTGFVIGYLTYEFRQVIVSGKVAWQKVFAKEYTIDIKLAAQWVWAYFKMLPGAFGMVLSFYLGVSQLVLLPESLVNHTMTLTEHLGTTLLLAITLALP